MDEIIMEFNIFNTDVIDVIKINKVKYIIVENEFNCSGDTKYVLKEYDKYLEENKIKDTN